MRASEDYSTFQIRKGVRFGDDVFEDRVCEGKQTQASSPEARVMNDIERSPFAAIFGPGRSIALDRRRRAFAASRRTRTKKPLLSVVDSFPKRFHRCRRDVRCGDDESEKVQREEETERIRFRGGCSIKINTRGS